MSRHVTPTTRAVTDVRIVRPMNDHGAMTVRVESGNEVRQIVEYGSTDVRDALERLPAGTTVPLETESVGMRGNAWRAVELGDDRNARDTSSSRTEYGAEQTHAPGDETHEHRETIQS